MAIISGQMGDSWFVDMFVGKLIFSIGMCTYTLPTWQVSQGSRLCYYIRLFGAEDIL